MDWPDDDDENPTTHKGTPASRNDSYRYRLENADINTSTAAKSRWCRRSMNCCVKRRRDIGSGLAERKNSSRIRQASEALRIELLSTPPNLSIDLHFLIIAGGRAD